MSWSAKTASGAQYEFDTDARTVSRSHVTSSGELAPDESGVPLVGTVYPVVGKPLTLFLVIQDDSVTARRTDPVVALSGTVPAIA
jgi:hypothetical protein